MKNKDDNPLSVFDGKTRIGLSLKNEIKDKVVLRGHCKLAIVSNSLGIVVLFYE